MNGLYGVTQCFMLLVCFHWCCVGASGIFDSDSDGAGACRYPDPRPFRPFANIRYALYGECPCTTVYVCVWPVLRPTPAPLRTECVP